ncbi:hypothetical protein LINPERPRIM_LOCUS23, partial [Linum perenne]
PKIIHSCHSRLCESQNSPTFPKNKDHPNFPRTRMIHISQQQRSSTFPIRQQKGNKGYLTNKT